MVVVTRGKEQQEGNEFVGWKGLHKTRVQILTDAIVVTEQPLVFPQRIRWTHREEANLLETNHIRPHFVPFIGRRFRFVQK